VKVVVGSIITLPEPVSKVAALPAPAALPLVVEAMMSSERTAAVEKAAEVPVETAADVLAASQLPKAVAVLCVATTPLAES
jgi:hypothetical protein